MNPHRNTQKAETAEPPVAGSWGDPVQTPRSAEQGRQLPLAERCGHGPLLPESAPPPTAAGSERGVLQGCTRPSQPHRVAAGPVTRAAPRALWDRAF